MKKVYLQWIIVFLMLNAAVNCLAQEEKKPVKQEILAENLSFELKTGEIKYDLSEPALVRVRIGIRNGGPFLRELLDWRKRDAGEHVEVWDFKDDTGLVNFGYREDYLVSVTCIPVNPKDLENYESTVRGFRHSPKFTITFPESVKKNNVSVVKSMDPVRIAINKEDQRWLTETKFEMALFINNAFLMEDEEGINPFTYRINTTGLREGIHTITVNVVGYEGEIGTKSVRVNFKK